MIKYHTLDPDHANDIKLPIGYDMCLNQDFLSVANTFVKQGFANVQIKPLNDSSFFNKSDNGKTADVTINQSTNFAIGEWTAYDAEIVISFHCETFEYANIVYENILDRFPSYGLQYELESLDDLNPGEEKNEGKIESITVDGKELSDSESYPYNAVAKVLYHSAKQLTISRTRVTKSSKDLEGEYFEEVERLLKGMGFTGIIQLEPVKKGWLNKEGNVKSVSIDGLTKFEVDTIFEKNATIIITYYSSDAE